MSNYSKNFRFRLEKYNKTYTGHKWSIFTKNKFQFSNFNFKTGNNLCLSQIMRMYIVRAFLSAFTRS